jgi:hypothetical protein
LDSDIKVDWQWDLRLQQWIVACELGGEHFFIFVCGQKNPASEPGYMEYIKDKARQVFKEKGVL